MSHCTTCGAALTAGKRFCTSCGTPLAAVVPPSSPPAAPPPSAPPPSVPSSAPPPSVPSASPLSASVGADGSAPDRAVIWLQGVAVVVAAVGLHLPWYRLPGRSFNAFELPAAVVLSFETTFRTLELGTVVLVAIGIAIGNLVAPGLLHRATLFSGIGLVGISLLFVIQTSRSLAGTNQGLTDVLGLGPIAIATTGVLLIVARLRAGTLAPTGAVDGGGGTGAAGAGVVVGADATAQHAGSGSLNDQRSGVSPPP